MTRRSFVALDRANTRCIVVDRAGSVAARLTAYELSLLRRQAEVLGSTEWERISRVVAMLESPCCYSFYAKPTHMIKFGMAQNVIRRWREIENRSGMPIQLTTVWLTDHPRALEKRIHTRFATSRGIGEWFDAESVIPALINPSDVLLEVANS